MALEFPALDPVAFEIGPLVVRWYALAYLAGFLLGWRYAFGLTGRIGGGVITRDHIDDFLTWAIAGVILGGRLGYVLFYNFEYYLANPVDVLKVWQGGMAFHGGIAGVAVVIVAYARVKKIPVLALADIVACAAPIGLFFGRIANFINGELYGRVSDVSWAMVFPRGGEMPRHPSQIYEAVLEGAVLFVILYFCSKRRVFQERPGILAGVFVAGYGSFRSFVELFREPDAHLGFVIGEVSMGQVLSLPMVVIGVGLMVYAWRNGRCGRREVS
jgi:phosphatidylglycerol:prolipoprotein diacylglycerol transferase